VPWSGAPVGADVVWGTGCQRLAPPVAPLRLFEAGGKGRCRARLIACCPAASLVRPWFDRPRWVPRPASAGQIVPSALAGGRQAPHPFFSLAAGFSRLFLVNATRERSRLEAGHCVSEHNPVETGCRAKGECWGANQPAVNGWPMSPPAAGKARERASNVPSSPRLGLFAAEIRASFASRAESDPGGVEVDSHGPSSDANRSGTRGARRTPPPTAAPGWGRRMTRGQRRGRPSRRGCVQPARSGCRRGAAAYHGRRLGGRWRPAKVPCCVAGWNRESRAARR